MKVLKFGGSSLASVDKLIQVKNIISSSVQDTAVSVVLSAMGNTTDDLLNLIETAKSNNNYHTQLETLQTFHTSALTQLKLRSDEQIQQSKNRILAVFNNIENWLQGISLLHQCPIDIEADIVTSGELLSVLLMQAALSDSFSNIGIIDAKKSIKTTSVNGHDVDLDRTKQNLQGQYNDKNSIHLMPGFVASTPHGKTSTLGRNGSDYSAALLAISLDAEECEIWTDVDGVFNANPREIPQAQLIQQLSYYEAMELSYFGASVLHPKTITPLMQAKIPCRIRNTNDIKNSGTLINEQPHSTNQFATAISNLTDICLITVSGPGMKGMVGMASRVFKTMSDNNISLILITQSSSEYSISFCINKESSEKAIDSLNSTFELELKAGMLEPLQVKDNLAIITLVSDNMKKRRGTAAQFFQALSIANVNIVAIAQGSNERSISAVIEQGRLMRGMKSCHQLFFDSRQVAEIILVGCGLVGDAFLQQIQQQQEHLKSKNIKLKVCGIVNSKGALLNENGIDISNYKNLLKTDLEEINRKKLRLFRQQSNMINPIVVDCTSSESVAEAYLDFLKAGYHIVAANKKANTLGMDYYMELKNTAIRHNRQFHYETNVGAGLPVIDTFRNLISAGDSLIQFQGILSGSMSFIFGKLDEGMTLSEAVKQARDKGFTEPDPRDDLSGMDVARKVLIIAREAGLNLELKDVKVDSILTQELIDCASIDDFMRSLSKIDSDVTERFNQAKEKGCVLRFIGSVEKGTCTVQIAEVPQSSALYTVKDGENAISFYSQYYQPIPMVLRGYGAGANVTAAGIFADVIKILPSKTNYY